MTEAVLVVEQEMSDVCSETTVPPFTPGRFFQGVRTEMCHQPELPWVSGKLFLTFTL